MSRCTRARARDTFLQSQLWPPNAPLALARAGPRLPGARAEPSFPPLDGAQLRADRWPAVAAPALPQRHSLKPHDRSAISWQGRVAGGPTEPPARCAAAARPPSGRQRPSRPTDLEVRRRRRSRSGVEGSLPSESSTAVAGCIVPRLCNTQSTNRPHLCPSRCRTCSTRGLPSAGRCGRPHT